VEECTDQRFITAALDYLEKNKDIFPETYEKAHEVYKDNACEVQHDEVNQLERNNQPTCYPNIDKAIHSVEAILLGLSLLEKKRINNRNLWGKKY